MKSLNIVRVDGKGKKGNWGRRRGSGKRVEEETNVYRKKKEKDKAWGCVRAWR